MLHPDTETLQRFIDEELGKRRTRKVSEHLERCEKCAGEVEAIRATGDALRLGFDAMVAEADFDGFADAVMAGIEKDPKPLPWTERAAAWLSEFMRYRRRVWVPSMALAGAAAVAFILAVAIGTDAPARSAPTGSSVISVSFGRSVEGTVFQLEDKDGSTTAVIWVDESKATTNGSEARRETGEAGPCYASKSKRKSTSAVALAARISYWGASGAKST